MVFADYMRTMCAPLQEIWVLSSKGFCRKGYTCTKGYTEAECKKECLKKSTPSVAEKVLEDIVGEKTIKVNVNSVRTRRPRTKKPPISED